MSSEKENKTGSAQNQATFAITMFIILVLLFWEDVTDVRLLLQREVKHKALKVHRLIRVPRPGTNETMLIDDPAFYEQFKMAREAPNVTAPPYSPYPPYPHYPPHQPSAVKAQGSVQPVEAPVHGHVRRAEAAVQAPMQPVTASVQAQVQPEESAARLPTSHVLARRSPEKAVTSSSSTAELTPFTVIPAPKIGEWRWRGVVIPYDAPDKTACASSCYKHGEEAHH
ncbi:hypothetical protein CYMTET_39875 [Cymbomonas tetramitiformis]|uniref:Uncharacterized protein n=1 Tax=Cymbomonas tetramitiformis TaxID=36881 RepID=A0AAE0CAF4_9CHLO|nr:hypothetical protein CYMTET_39875 [Cymbomonas tetramitiformis]